VVFAFAVCWICYCYLMDMRGGDCGYLMDIGQSLDEDEEKLQRCVSRGLTNEGARGLWSVAGCKKLFYLANLRLLSAFCTGLEISLIESSWNARGEREVQEVGKDLYLCKETAEGSIVCSRIYNSWLHLHIDIGFSLFVHLLLFYSR
jgi:hypothetical protein